MLDITKDIQSLTTFRRSSGDFMKQLKKTKRPVVLTVNGKAAAVVQDAEAYQRLLDIRALADAEEGNSSISFTATSLTSIESYFMLLRNRSGLRRALLDTVKVTN
jgi:prevent-host-death family protein